MNSSLGSKRKQLAPGYTPVSKGTHLHLHLPDPRACPCLTLGEPAQCVSAECVSACQAPGHACAEDSILWMPVAAPRGWPGFRKRKG